MQQQGDLDDTVQHPRLFHARVLSHPREPSV